MINQIKDIMSEEKRRRKRKKYLKNAEGNTKSMIIFPLSNIIDFSRE